MRQELTDTIHKLETNKKFAINVTDLDSGKNICRNKTGEMLKNEYGSIKGFFENINDKKISRIGVQSRIRNGSSNLNGSEPYFTLQFGEDKPLNSPSEIYHEKPKAATTLTGVMQLGFPDALDLYSKAKTQESTAIELQYAKKRIEDLEKITAEYKEEIFQNRFSKDERQEKRASNDSLMSMLLTSPIITGLAGKLIGGFNSPVAEISEGLGNPSLSPLKNEIIQAISQSSEETADFIGKVFDGFNNAEFTNNLIELLKKHNLWTPQEL